MPFDSAAAAAAELLARPTRHLIGGVLRTGSESFAVINPSCAMPFADCPAATKAQLDEAVEAARRASGGWAGTPVEARRQCLTRLAQALEAHVGEFAAITTLEQGKPLQRAYEEVRRAVGLMTAVTSIPLEPALLRDGPHERVEMHYRPLGVVGAITPWNMPIILAVAKLAHALYTGNTVVLKPSPYTPLATLRLGELAREIVPAGVVNVLAGGNDLGRWMSEHPDIDKISFTGSVPTGKRVMGSAAGSLKRLTLELGGNDPAIVLPDVDVKAAAPRLFASAFANCGQVCIAVKRLFVHADVYDQLADEMARLARSVKVGDGFDAATEMGPLQNRPQFEIVKEILADTKAAGATIMTGGRSLDRPGYFIEPTVVRDIAPGTRLVDEEPFGPVLPIIRFSDVDEAVAEANAVSVGLGASVWSRDVQRAKELAIRLQAGMVAVNRHVHADPFVPFAGSKQSGLGREFGLEGLLENMQPMPVFVPVEG